MLQETLKQATQNNHDELEGLMFVHQIMGGTLTLQQYKQILTTNYILHKQFEAIVMNALGESVAAELDAEHRHKLDALEADMNSLQIPLPLSNVNEQIIFNNEAEALGALYVLEGATLGGNVIVKRLKVNPNLSPLNLDFKYYRVYGEDLIPNWKRFCEVLNKQPESTFTDSIAGAKKMFGYIAQVQRESNQIAIA